MKAEIAAPAGDRIPAVQILAATSLVHKSEAILSGNFSFSVGVDVSFPLPQNEGNVSSFS